MPKTVRILCALLVLSSLVAFTGCGDDKKSGGDTKAEYKKGAEKAAQDFKDSAQSASAQVKSATTDEDRLKGLDALKASVNQAADDFEALDPPDNVKADNDELVGEFRELASIVDDVKGAVQSKDQAAAQAALGKLAQSQSKITTTIQSIESKVGK